MAWDGAVENDQALKHLTESMVINYNGEKGSH